MSKRRNSAQAKSVKAKPARSKAQANTAAPIHRDPHLAEQGWFTWFAHSIARWSGKPATFLIALALIVFWAVTGPLFGFSDTWQLVVNTATTIVTFLMVFLIQNTQTRDGTAVQLKLDELIRAIEGAHNGLLDLEELSDEDLARLRAHFEALARVSREDLQRGLRDTGTIELATD